MSPPSTAFADSRSFWCSSPTSPRRVNPDFSIGAIVKAISGIGSTGVDLFFVLSGFLITGILLDAKSSPHFFRNFYARRTLRIFPLYYGVLIACFLIVPLFHPFSPAEQQVANRQGWLWLYAANIRESFTNAYYPFSGGWIAMDHFWSLAIEEHFYLLWPLVIFFASRRTMIGICIAVIAIALGTRLGLYLSEIESMAYYHLTPCRMDELAMGGLIVLLARSPGGAAKLVRIAWGIASVSLMALILTWRFEWREYIFGSTLLAMFFAALLVCVVSSGLRNPLRLLFQNRGLRLLGKFSYGAYVLHPLVRSTIMQSLSPQKLTALTALGICRLGELHDSRLRLFAHCRVVELASL